jgi:nucleotide sugar dehydrogenase
VKLTDIKLGVIGLGYVGLPLAVEFSKKRKVIGFDINSKRIFDLKNNIDKTHEVQPATLEKLNNLSLTDKIDDLEGCNFYIITVPTPITKDNKPDLEPIIDATKTVASLISKNHFVVYESTVYPGVTEDICVPIIEESTGMKLNKDFYVGYSPERINPGDMEHTLTNIVKVISGSNKFASNIINKLYDDIILAGTYIAPSIRIAEAAKVIENTQRDLNIALVNELSKIFTILNIDTSEVLKAAGTKWNFLNFQPGLVGGHCIGVDPYYLTYKAQLHNYDPEVILAGRRLNDGMAKYVANKLLEMMEDRGIEISESRILIMGLTFKENCPDIRNSKVFDIITELNKKKCTVDVCDPWLEVNSQFEGCKFQDLESISHGQYDGIVLAVGHSAFLEFGIKEINNLKKSKCVFYDLKSIFPVEDSDLRL